MSIVEWAILGVILLVVATRIAVGSQFAVPPLTDSLHHAMLTRAVVETGRLPVVMPVFESIPLDRYHLGLYSITASVAWLGAVPPVAALLWVGQAMNVLAAVAVYVLLDRYVSRRAACVGILAAGLIHHMPNSYFAWGRFTQVTGQALMPLAWAVGWAWLEGLHATPNDRKRTSSLALSGLALALATATILVHLRVGIFLVSALTVSACFEGLSARREGRAKHFLRSFLGFGAVALLAVLPRYGVGLYHWVWGHWFLSLDGNGWSGGDDLRGINSDVYFSVWLDSPIWDLVGPPLLVAMALLTGLVAVWRGNRLARVTSVWVCILLLLGTVHFLRIHVLDVLPTNAILIFAYFPLAIFLGCGLEASLSLLSSARAVPVGKATFGTILAIALLAIPTRVQEIPLAYNLVTQGDRQAFRWIKRNTPEKATFAIAAYNLLPSFPVGTDGGYWIPYFTGRRTTPGPMLSALAPRFLTHASETVEIQRQPGFSDEKVNALIRHGVRYFYFSRSAAGMIDAEKLAKSPNVELVYRQHDVQILKLGQ